MSAITDLSNKVSQSFATLSSRERLMVTVAGVAVTAFILFMIIFSFASKADAIRRRTADKLIKLERVQELAANYGAAKATQDNFERQLAGSNVRLLSYLEEKGTRAGLNIPSINPKADVTLEGDKIVESAAEFTLTDIPLNRLTDFLAAVEQGPGMVKVKYLRIEPHVKDEHLTAYVTVATYRLK
jgi:general secretion pathway protein M